MAAAVSAAGTHERPQGLARDDAREQPAEEDEPADAHAHRDEADQHGPRDAQAHAASEGPQPRVEVHGRSPSSRVRPGPPRPGLRVSRQRDASRSPYPASHHGSYPRRRGNCPTAWSGPGDREPSDASQGQARHPVEVLAIPGEQDSSVSKNDARDQAVPIPSRPSQAELSQLRSLARCSGLISIVVACDAEDNSTCMHVHARRRSGLVHAMRRRTPRVKAHSRGSRYTGDLLRFGYGRAAARLRSSRQRRCESEPHIPRRIRILPQTARELPGGVDARPSDPSGSFDAASPLTLCILGA